MAIQSITLAISLMPQTIALPDFQGRRIRSIECVEYSLDSRIDSIEASLFFLRNRRLNGIEIDWRADSVFSRYRKSRQLLA